MKIATTSKGQYDVIKSLLLGLITFLIGPSIFAYLMASVTDGDTQKYLMLMGLIFVGVLFIFIYRLLTIEEAKEEVEEDEEEEEAVVKEDKVDVDKLDKTDNKTDAKKDTKETKVDDSKKPKVKKSKDAESDDVDDPEEKD